MDETLTAEQKIRQQLAGSPVGEPHFQHEGEKVVRWITGGTLPDLHVTFHKEGDQTIVVCANCKNIIGYLPVNGETTDIAARLVAMRKSGHDH